jgi:hypothetical protein
MSALIYQFVSNQFSGMIRNTILRALRNFVSCLAAKHFCLLLLSLIQEIQAFRSAIIQEC